MNSQHYPVMNKEVIDIFQDTDQQLFIDCTLGMGGHSYKILENFETSRVLGVDIDAESMKKAADNLSKFQHRVEYKRINYTRLFQEMNLEDKPISGILVDPGISIPQLKEKERGFSHNIDDAPLDMRKDQTAELTAYDVVNTYKLAELRDLLDKYGELKNPHLLARKIIETRLFGKIETTGQLKELVEKVYKWHPKRGKSHPAAKVFQALRIVVNGELEGIDSFLEDAVNTLKKGARIIFLTFHSVEDRMIKHIFVNYKKQNRVKIIKPFPAVPSEEEVAENFASRSTKLRAVEIL